MTDQARCKVRVLVFHASLRKEPDNAKLAHLAASSVKQERREVDLATIREFDRPSYDQDVEREQGIPSGAKGLCRQLKAADAFIIASPECNASMPGLLENIIEREHVRIDSRAEMLERNAQGPKPAIATRHGR
jgi:chromate reductase, NAD(P)H dehydrogenase (quinone)